MDPIESSHGPNRSSTLADSMGGWEATAGELTAAVIYGIGLCVYVPLCLPAIDQRGFPPIDPVWTGVTFLWIVPILVVEILARGPVRGRRLSLAFYCFATGFFFDASLVNVVPKQVDFGLTLLTTVLLFGPLHWGIGVLIAALVARTRRAAPGFVRSLPASPNLIRWSAVGGVLALTVAFPFLFRQFVYFDMKYRGYRQAEKDWDQGKAVRYAMGFPELSEVTVTHEFDPATGLRYRRTGLHDLDRFRLAYNRRVDELLREQGIPDWSMKPYLVVDDQLVALLDSTELREVERFPYELNDSIVLFRRGRIERWGKISSSNSDSLNVATKGGLLGIGGRGEPAYVWHSAEHPKLVFIRSGRRWVGAFHEEGELLSSASRF